MDTALGNVSRQGNNRRHVSVPLGENRTEQARTRTTQLNKDGQTASFPNFEGPHTERRTRKQAKKSTAQLQTLPSSNFQKQQPANFPPHLSFPFAIAFTFRFVWFFVFPCFLFVNKYIPYTPTAHSHISHLCL